MSAFAVEPAIELLARTPRVLDAWLRGLDPCWSTADDGEGGWSAFDVVGHLIHGERTDWIPRLRSILEYGEARTFTPFDREAMFAASRGKSLDVLLDEFAALRAENVRTLREAGLLPSDLTRLGRHPDFGPVTLRQLLATWVVHDLGHLRQIARTMAAQYAAEVGPWRAYLSILDDAEAARARAR